MDTAADLITDPVARYRVLRRHFSWELGKLLGERFLKSSAEEQQLVLQGVRKLAEAYLTDEMRASLNVQRRVPLSVAQFGTADDVAAVARHQLENGLAPVVIDRGRSYVAYPGFRDPERRFPTNGSTSPTNCVRSRIRPAPRRWPRPARRGRRAMVIRWRSTIQAWAGRRAGAAPAGGRPGGPNRGRRRSGPCRAAARRPGGRRTAAPPDQDALRRLDRRRDVQLRRHRHRRAPGATAAVPAGPGVLSDQRCPGSSGPVGCRGAADHPARGGQPAAQQAGRRRSPR